MSNHLSLEKRVATGKKLKDLRAAGQIPSVVYGGEMPIMTVSNYNLTDKALREVGYHSPIELDIDGRAQLAIVKHVDVDPVSRRIMNIEFQAISADEVVTTTTPIKIVGYEESDAAKKHYVLAQVLSDVDIKARPSALPQELIVSGQGLAEVDDRLTLADLQLPDSVELADAALSAETLVATVRSAESNIPEAEPETSESESDANDADDAPADEEAQTDEATA